MIKPLPNNQYKRQGSMQTPHTLSLTILFTFFLFHLLHSQPILAVAAPPPDSAPSPQPNNDTGTDTDFIRTSCNHTLYPEVCYSSLSGYANTVHQNPAQLASLAISVSLTKAQEMASYVSNVSRQYDGIVTTTSASFDSRTAAALHDCFSVMDDAVGEICGSLKQMKQISAETGGGGGNKESFRFQMSNVQTWMSAALTNEDTCEDGFEETPDEPIKSDICGRALDVKKVTSIALALINDYVNSYR